MKIGIFLPNATFDLPGSPEVGGIETFSFTVGEAWQRVGHDVVLFGGAPKLGRQHRTTTIRLELLPYWETRSIPDLGTRFQRLMQRLHFGWRCHAAWKEQRCDVLLLAKPFDWPVAWWWKRSQPKLQVIMGFHGTDFFAGDRSFYGAIDQAFAVSKPVAELAETRVHRRPALIPNPVEVDFFQPQAQTQIKTGDWQIAASGRLVGWKGFSNLVEAVARLRDEHGVRAHLTIAGQGPERENLLAQINRLDLALQVSLPGLLERGPLREMLRKAELYVMPSVGLEAFSISALEGASVGLPLLLSDQVGLASFLTEVDAMTYSARNVGALVSALKILHERRYDAAWIDAAARHARLREEFAPDRVARKILDLLT